MMRLRWGFFALPTVFYFSLLFVIPVFVFISQSFHKDLGYGQVSEAFTIINYVKIFKDPFFFRVLQLSLSLSLRVVIITILIAYPVAYCFVNTEFRWKSALIPLLFIPSFITVVIRALGWIIILRSNGPLNKVLLDLRLIDESIQFLGTDTGVIIGLVHFVLPLAALSLISVLQTIPSSLEEAARGLGAPPRRVFMRVILPISLPGVISVSLMIFSLSISIFSTVMILGGGRVFTLPILIQQEIIRKVNYSLGAAVSMILLFVVLVINISFNMLAGRMWAARGGNA
jgi:putative spermidine/putrescine transport system permease protein